MKGLLKDGKIKDIQIGDFTITVKDDRFICRQTKTGFLSLESSINDSYQFVRDWCINNTKYSG